MELLGPSDDYPTMSRHFSDMDIHDRRESRPNTSRRLSLASPPSNKEYYYYKMTRIGDSWSQARLTELPGSQDDIRTKVFKAKSDNGSVLTQLEKMGDSRRRQISQLCEKMSKNEVDDSLWEPVWLENADTKKKRDGTLAVLSFKIILARRSSPFVGNFSFGQRRPKMHRETSGWKDEPPRKTSEQNERKERNSRDTKPKKEKKARDGEKQASKNTFSEDAFSNTKFFNNDGQPLHRMEKIHEHVALPPFIPPEKPIARDLPNLKPSAPELELLDSYTPKAPNLEELSGPTSNNALALGNNFDDDERYGTHARSRPTHRSHSHRYIDDGRHDSQYHSRSRSRAGQRSSTRHSYSDPKYTRGDRRHNASHSRSSMASFEQDHIWDNINDDLSSQTSDETFPSYRGSREDRKTYHTYNRYHHRPSDHKRYHSSDRVILVAEPTRRSRRSSNARMSVPASGDYERYMPRQSSQQQIPYAAGEVSPAYSERYTEDQFVYQQPSSSRPLVHQSPSSETQQSMPERLYHSQVPQDSKYGHRDTGFGGDYMQNEIRKREQREGEADLRQRSRDTRNRKIRLDQSQRWDRHRSGQDQVDAALMSGGLKDNDYERRYWDY